ncbi:MAG: ABC transporter substrate-binding protein [Pseudomonadota bacterium]
MKTIADFATVGMRPGTAPGLISVQTLTRRGILSGLFTMAALAGLNATADGSPPAGRTGDVVCLDYAVTQMALSVDVTPIGISRPEGYRRSVVEPILPGGVIDVGGIASEPNLELLHYLKPRLIITNDSIRASAGDVLARVAPVVSPYQPEAVNLDPYEVAETEHRTCSAYLDRAGEGERYRHQLNETISQLAKRIRWMNGAPILLVSVVDQRHLYVFAKNSIFSGVLQRMGLANAWIGAAAPLGMSLVGLENIAHLEATIVVIGADSSSPIEIEQSRLWRALRPVREARVVTLPPVWTVGGLPVADRFARNLVAGLANVYRSDL